MTTIGVVSDTHGWLDPQLLNYFSTSSVIFHGGDIGSHTVLDELATVTKVLAVRGNIDGPEFCEVPYELSVNVAGKTVVARHICGSPRRPNRATRELIVKNEADIIIVGHSHIPVVQKVLGALWVNPGAAGRVGFHTERFAARIHISDDGQLSMDRIELGPRSRRA